jgi:hypothetical protein
MAVQADSDVLVVVVHLVVFAVFQSLLFRQRNDDSLAAVRIVGLAQVWRCGEHRNNGLCPLISCMEAVP